MHLHHGRLDDRLTFDAQTEIAPVMKFKDKGGLRAVERFMKYLTDQTLIEAPYPVEQLFHESVLDS